MAYFSQIPGHQTLMLEELAGWAYSALGNPDCLSSYSLMPEGDQPETKDFILRTRHWNQQLVVVGAAGDLGHRMGWSSYLGPKVEQPIIGE